LIHLEQLGWSSFFRKHWQASDADRTPARVVEEQKDAYRVACEAGVLLAEVAGHLRYNAKERSDFPAVGDWVAVDARADEGRATIHRVLPRKTKFSRKVAGTETSEQIVAANIDTIFLVTSLNADLNLRRIERYLTTIWESGAQPVILLSKADLCDDPAGAVEAVYGSAIGVPIHVLSALSGQGMEQLDPYIKEGQTVALLGSSGVGKSTIINRFIGADTQKTREIREDNDRGRHATSSRRLFVLPHGGILIDTPGMRELQLWDAASGLGQTFEDIETFASRCRFRDCQHETEPDCAVQAALTNGKLNAGRFQSYLKLKRELAYLTRKQDIVARIEENNRWKAIHKAMRQHYKFGPRHK
jgi:ribosome biogenesis GTPase